MFMGPFDQSIARSTNGISGVKKFLEKIMKLFDKIDDSFQDENDTEILLNQSIKKLTEDIDGFRFNTAVSQLMILVNHLTEKQKISKKVYEKLVILVAPMAPHTAEEMREKLGNQFSIFTK
jgi:leucyl-tRNA synthetase